MTPTELRQIVANGEGPTVEFKREFNTAIDKELVAFANSNGGLVLIGVSDDAVIVGISEDLRRLEERIMGVCRANCRPSLTPEVEVVTIDGENVVVVKIQESDQITTARDICYVRAGSTTRRALPEELQRLALKTAPTAFERTPVHNLTFDDLNLTQMLDYFQKRSPRATQINGIRLERLALGQHFAVALGDELVPTVAGVLLFGLQPQLGHPEWGLSAVKFSGVEISDPISDRVDIEGRLDEMLQEVETFVLRNMRTAAVFDENNPIRRIDLAEYPISAVRESVVNALAHRDYSQPARVNLRIYDDRLELTNPGPLPARLNLDELIYQGGISFPRNPIIAGVMREWGFMEQVGRGLVHIRRQMQELGSEEPQFKSTDVGFTVIFPSRHRTLST